MIPDIEGEGVPPKEKAKIAQREGLPVDGIKNYFTAMILSRAAEHEEPQDPVGESLIRRATSNDFLIGDLDVHSTGKAAD